MEDVSASESSANKSDGFRAILFAHHVGVKSVLC